MTVGLGGGGRRRMGLRVAVAAIVDAWAGVIVVLLMQREVDDANRCCHCGGHCRPRQ